MCLWKPLTELLSKDAAGCPQGLSLWCEILPPPLACGLWSPRPLGLASPVFITPLNPFCERNVKVLNSFCLPASFMLITRVVSTAKVSYFSINKGLLLPGVTDLSRRAVTSTAEQPQSHLLGLMVTSNAFSPSPTQANVLLRWCWDGRVGSEGL